MATASFPNMSSGLDLDVYPPDTLPTEWTGAQNIRFRDGYAEKMQGHAGIFGTPSGAPYAVFPVNGVNGIYWVYCTLTNIYCAQNSTNTDITRQSAGVDVPYVGTAANRWNGGTLTGVLVLNNGVDVPQQWGGNPATPMANLSNWPASTTAQIIRPFRNFLIAMNITQSGVTDPSLVWWSTEAAPGAVPVTWSISDATHDAGQQDLADTPDMLIDGLALGQTFLAYKGNSTWLAQYIGDPYVFSWQPISKQSGILAQNCAVEWPGGHAVMTQGDIVTIDFNGNVVSIADARVRNYLFNTIDSTNFGNSFAVANFRRNEVWFCFPTLGNTWPNQALIWNWKLNTWGVRDLPNVTHANSGVVVYNQGNSWQVETATWATQTKVWGQNEFSQTTQRVVMSSVTNNALYLADVGETINGTLMNAQVQKTGIIFGDATRMKQVTEVWPVIEAPAGTVVNISVGAQIDCEAPITWSGPYPFTVGTSVKVDTLGAPQTRYVGVMFQTQAICTWRVRNFTMNADLLGTY
jgi:hypothetical protein